MTELPPGSTAARLYDLLPAVHRVRDGSGLLAELIGLLAGQVDVIDEEISQLYDDQFVETSAPWAVAYLGGLIGFRLGNGAAATGSLRDEVANTVAYRRRKGTAAVIEQVARDVTLWPARVVEEFEQLVTTQYLNHVRPQATAAPTLRDHRALHWIGTAGGAFDDLHRTADVRRVDAPKPQRPGRYGIRKVAVFLWRTQPVPLERSPLVHHADDRRFRFDPLGADAPLFAFPRPETATTHLAEPLDVPLALGRRWTAENLGRLYGASVGGLRRSLLLERQAGASEPVAIPLEQVRICDLSDAPGGGGGAWAHEPPTGMVAIDPVRGRVYLGDALPAGERLLGTCATGMAVPVGAGNLQPATTPAPEPEAGARAGEPLQPLLDAATGGGTVRILDSDRYTGPLAIRTVAGPTPELELRLAAAAHARPTIVADEVRLELAPHTTVVLEGLLVAGGPVVLDEVGDTLPRRIVLRDSTLVPGITRTPDGQPAHPERASLIILDPAAEVRIERCVVGPIVAVEGARVELVDSVVDASARTAAAICGRDATDVLRTVTSTADHVVGDGTAVAGDLDLTTTTVVGGIRCTVLDASDSLLVARLAPGDPRPAPVQAERRQQGCVRYTFVPPGSRTGRRFHCLPDPDDPASVQRATRPRFDALRYGDPAYARLSAGTHDALRRGADDEGEPGVTHRLHAPQREDDLVLRFDEYLRLGLSAGWFYAS
jgi:hypothetical protein